MNLIDISTNDIQKSLESISEKDNEKLYMKFHYSGIPYDIWNYSHYDGKRVFIYYICKSKVEYAIEQNIFMNDNLDSISSDISNESKPDVYKLLCFDYVLSINVIESSDSAININFDELSRKGYRKESIKAIVLYDDYQVEHELSKGIYI